MKDLVSKCWKTEMGNEEERHDKESPSQRAAYLLQPDFVAMTTILYHNFGYQEASILKALQIDTTALERSLEIQDHTRMKKSSKDKAKE